MYLINIILIRIAVVRRRTWSVQRSNEVNLRGQNCVRKDRFNEQTITGDMPKNHWVTTGSFFAGRVYAPSAMSGSMDLSVFFAGYHTPQPKKAPAIAAPLGRISL